MSSAYDEILTSMKSRYKELTGFEADDASDIGIRIKVLAEQASIIAAEAGELKKQVFPQTATGNYLDMHAETKGLARKSAIPSVGVLRFGREIPSVSNIEIAVGTVCATASAPQIRFATTGKGILAAGNTYMDIPAEALDGGKLGNVAAGRVSVMVTAPPGISTVTNPDSFSGGVDEEVDEALRERLLESYRNISNGTNRAFYYDLAMSQEGVASANVLPRKRGRGTVDVAVACASAGIQTRVVGELQELLAERKEVNVDVLVYAATETLVNVTLAVAPQEGHSFDVVKAACEQAIKTYLAGMAVGAPLYLAVLGRLLLSLDGVENYKIMAPAADIATSGAAVLRPGVITVSRLVI